MSTSPEAPVEPVGSDGPYLIISKRAAWAGMVAMLLVAGSALLGMIALSTSARQNSQTLKSNRVTILASQGQIERLTEELECRAVATAAAVGANARMLSVIGEIVEVTLAGHSDEAAAALTRDLLSAQRLISEAVQRQDAAARSPCRV